MNTSRRVVGRYAALGLVLGLVVLGVFWVLFQPLRGASTQKPPLGSATVTQTVAPTSETTIPVTSSTAPVSTSPTTVTATTALRASGVKAKNARAVVDQAAAVAILQGWLDARR